MLKVLIDVEHEKFEITACGTAKELTTDTMLLTSAIYSGINSESRDIYKAVITAGCLSGLAFQKMNKEHGDTEEKAEEQKQEEQEEEKEEYTVELSEILKELGIDAEQFGCADK